MYGCDDQNLLSRRQYRSSRDCSVCFAYFVLLRNVPHKTHNLEARRRIQPTSRFIQEQNLWTGHELTGDTDSPLLATRHALSNRRSDQCVSLVLESKSRQ
jgi:hypothetical protein